MNYFSPLRFATQGNECLVKVCVATNICDDEKKNFSCWLIAVLCDYFYLSGSNFSCHHLGTMVFMVMLWQHAARTAMDNLVLILFQEGFRGKTLFAGM